VALNRTKLLKLARAGAAARLAELQAEIDDIRRSFPDLRSARSTRSRGNRASGRTRRTRGWTAAQRKAAAERMRKYWASRKAGKK
jgi:hypothetical protein